MFTWICPQCGREVPPSYSECPDCARKQKQGAAESSGEPAAPAPPAAAPPPVPPPVPPPIRAAAPKPVPVVPRTASRAPSIPTWLLSILFAFAFVGLGAGVYWLVNYMRDRGQTAPQTQSIPLEQAPKAGKAKPHLLQKYIEVTGVRFIQDARKATEVRFVIVNHSPDEISDLGGVVTIWGRTQKSDEEAVGSFAFKLPTIRAWESKEMSAQMNTKLRVYELPDWQNITAEVQLTSP